MEKKLTRNEAASYLGVTPQTITNWFNSGKISGYKDPNSNALYINLEDVKKYAGLYKMIVVKESTIKSYKDSLDQDIANLEVQLHEQIKSGKLVKLFGEVSFGLNSFFIKFIKDNDILTDRELKVVDEMLQRVPVKVIANELQLTTNRVNIIFDRSLRKIKSSLAVLQYKLSEVDKLRVQVFSLQHKLKEKSDELKRLKSIFDINRSTADVTSSNISLSDFEIMNKKLDKLRFRTGIIRHLEDEGIYTLYDLIQCTEYKLQNIKFIGEYSLLMIKRRLNHIGLGLKLDQESDIEYIKRFNMLDRFNHI